MTVTQTPVSSPAPDGGGTSQPCYLEVQSLAVTDDEQRLVSGLALPYDEEIDRFDPMTGATKLSFAPGSAVFRDNTIFYFAHDHLEKRAPIGRVLSNEQTDKGPKIAARVSKTLKGDEIYELMKPDEDGKAVLDRFSIGFWPVKSELLNQDSENPVLRHLEIDVFEVSVVPDPAYKSAVIDNVLSARPPTTTKEPAMTETLVSPEGLATSDEVATLSASIDNLERRIATLGVTEPDNTPQAPGNSYGEFLQMAARGDKEAMDFLAYVGSTIGDLGDWVKDSWVGDIYRPITEKRRLHNLFESSPLPANGMNVEYGKLLADTTDVDEQVAEGDVLAYGKIEFETATAPLKTYGGWGEMSRQEIERSAMAVVEKFYSALVNRYSQVTEAALRAIAIDVANAHVLAGTGTHDLATADGWIDYVVDAAFWLEDKGLHPEFVLVGRPGFKDLAKLRDGDNADAPRLLDRNSGRVNLVGLGGEIFNLPVIPVAGLTTARVGHSSAIRTFEAGGQPFRLQDDDITNLTKAFSIYGYEAIAVQDDEALVAPDVTA